MTKLSDICNYRSDKVAVSQLNDLTYISTENMLPNRGGITKATTLPTIPYTQSFLVGDVLVSNIRPYFKKVWQAEWNGGCSNDVLVFRANESIDADFLYYLLSSDDFFAYSMATSKGTKMPRGDKTAIMQYSVPDVDLVTQKKVSSILKSLDKKIRENKQINDNLLQQCTTFYDEICYTADFALMSELVSVVETGSRPKGGAQTNGIPSIGAEKIERFGTYDYSGEKFISEDYFTQLKRGIIGSGDVLLYKDGAYTGKSSMALDGFPHERCAVNEHVFIIRTANMKHQHFLYFTLQNDDIHQRIYSLACGKAAQPGLNQSELLSVSIKLPSEEVLEAFNEQVNPLMHRIALNALESKHLSDLRDTMLPKLMSGEIDVSSIEID